jgi:propanediol dehydratase small subunit
MVSFVTVDEKTSDPVYTMTLSPEQARIIARTLWAQAAIAEGKLPEVGS